ncbi:hypothetical protein A9Q90_10075 [Gammaproteobacteria bacterium 54_18_T64]|nr:hypothetical protein A9Q90_10075 [Gammaproteobacteria bacterium 54_18_T64]
MQDAFYLRLEERFRGSEQQIAERLRQYLPLLESLEAECLEQQVQASALDLGCGRGEWLSLLSQRQWQVAGIDLNASMVERCQQQGFDVFKQDALACLKALPDQSLNLISGFHIAEHIAFDELLEIICQAHRVLLPAGVLLLETPNPENLAVGAHTFYMDPSHRHPLPPQLLQFAAQEQGFAQVDVRRLNGAARPQNAMAFGDHIEWFLETNLDYVVLAQKQGQTPATETLVTAALDNIGEANPHHIEFYGLAREYVQQTHQRIEKVDRDYQRVAQEQQNQINTLLQQTQYLQEVASQSEVHIKQLQETVGQIQNSGFMRLVGAVNRVKRFNVYRKHHGFKATGQLAYKKVGNGLARRVMARPKLQKNALSCTRKSPKMSAWLHSFLALETPVSEPVFDTPRAGEIWRDLNEP